MASSRKERASSIRLVDADADGGALKKETEFVQENSNLISEISPSTAFSFIIHVSRWLYRQQSLSATPKACDISKVKKAVESLTGLFSGAEDNDLSIRAWNSTFDQEEPATWISVLKLFVWRFEILVLLNINNLAQQ